MLHRRSDVPVAHEFHHLVHRNACLGAAGIDGGAGSMKVKRTSAVIGTDDLGLL
jgi:hypothetical protein